MEMTLKLPSNYHEIEEEEMMYLDGGSWDTFQRNIKGVYNRYSNVSRALRAGGWGWGKVCSALADAARFGYWWAVGTFGWPAAKIGAIVAGTIGAIIMASGVTAGIWYLYNNRVFY